ncbi:MAG: DUF4145 domain-containing protein [Bacteroidales bacterium]|nr:DUF4145 domain-containing protein [Bacteroidales bacterium]
MEYIAPKKEAGRFTCPHCHTLATMESAIHRFQSDSNEDWARSNKTYTLYISKCQSCKRKIIWVNDDYVYPDIQQEEPNPDMPDGVLQLYKEAGLIYNKSPRAACALLRLAIDRLCNELGETNKDIDKNIAALVKKGLPKGVQEALDVVRVVGNKAVHPGQIDFDVDNIETAQILFGLVNMIVERLISEPKKLDSYYNRLPQSAREAIEKRDK